jgi:ribonuclease P protein component
MNADRRPRPAARFPRTARLTKTAQFQAAFARRDCAGDDLLLVFALRNGLDSSRLGLSVSRKVGGAVMRNAWKRRLREAFRMERSRLPAGYDFVVVPRPTAEPRGAALAPSLVALARRAVRKIERRPKDAT